MTLYVVLVVVPSYSITVTMYSFLFLLNIYFLEM